MGTFHSYSFSLSPSSPPTPPTPSFQALSHNGLLLQHCPLQVTLLPEFCSNRQRHLQDREQVATVNIKLRFVDAFGEKQIWTLCVKYIKCALENINDLKKKQKSLHNNVH